MKCRISTSLLSYLLPSCTSVYHVFHRFIEAHQKLECNLVHDIVLKVLLFWMIDGAKPIGIQFDFNFRAHRFDSSWDFCFGRWCWKFSPGFICSPVLHFLDFGGILRYEAFHVAVGAVHIGLVKRLDSPAKRMLFHFLIPTRNFQQPQLLAKLCNSKPRKGASRFEFWDRIFSGTTSPAVPSGPASIKNRTAIVEACEHILASRKKTQPVGLHFFLPLIKERQL